MTGLNLEEYLTLPNWRHVKTGKLYKIVGFVTNEADLRTMVVYRSASHPTSFTVEPVWVRPLSEFMDGRFVRLFPGIDLGKSDE